MRFVAIISRTECSLFGDGVTLRCGGMEECMVISDGGRMEETSRRRDG